MKKFLIIDDETGIANEIRDYFSEEGFEVFNSDTGKEGISSIEKIQPDIILLDIKLPDISGLDVLKAAKELSPKSRIIVTTGYVDQQIIDEAERLGRDAFLQKPFDLEALAEEINRLL